MTACSYTAACQTTVHSLLYIACAGKQHYLDATVAYKRAVLNAIHYISKVGWLIGWLVY